MNVLGIVVYSTPLIAFACGCKPINSGQSNANEAPVSDGHVVLLRRNNEIGAFVLNRQTMHPERTDFTWYYRADGKGTFAVDDPAVTRGAVSNATGIAFATFSVQWSINTDGRGWVYFSSGPVEFGMKPDFVMCVTSETNIANIDATNRKWRYRGRPGVNIEALMKSQFQ